MGERLSVPYRIEMAEKAGYRVATYGDRATHAICIHGVIADLSANDHMCSWILLVKVEEEVF